MRKSHLVQLIVIVVALLFLHREADAIWVGISSGQTFLLVLPQNGTPAISQTTILPLGLQTTSVEIPSQTYTLGADTMVSGCTSQVGFFGGTFYIDATAYLSVGGPDALQGVGNATDSYAYARNIPDPLATFPPGDLLAPSIDATVTGYLAPGDTMSYQFDALAPGISIQPPTQTILTPGPFSIHYSSPGLLIQGEDTDYGIELSFTGNITKGVGGEHLGSASTLRLA